MGIRGVLLVFNLIEILLKRFPKNARAIERLRNRIKAIEQFLVHPKPDERIVRHKKRPRAREFPAPLYLFCPSHVQAVREKNVALRGVKSAPSASRSDDRSRRSTAG